MQRRHAEAVTMVASHSPWPTALAVAAPAVLAVLVEQHRHRRWHRSAERPPRRRPARHPTSDLPRRAPHRLAPPR